MEQPNLWMTHAQCTGLVINYQRTYLEDGCLGSLLVSPQWSKRPQHPGQLNIRLDQCSEEVLPQLAYGAFEGILTTDPGYFVPRRIKHHLGNYNDACNYELQP